MQQGNRYAVTGITRMGKSYFVKKTLIPILADKKPVIILDRNEEYTGRNARDHNKSWLGYNGFNEFIESVHKNKGVISKKVHVIVCSSVYDYQAICMLLVRLERPVTLIIDEAHDLYLDRDFYPAKKYVMKMCRWGGKFSIDLVMISQRPSDLPPDIRTQLMGAISFHLNSTLDIDKYEKEKGWKNAEKLRDLPKHKYVTLGEIPAHVEKKI